MYRSSIHDDQRTQTERNNMSYKPTYEDPEYYDDSESDEADWQEMEDAEEDEYGPYITINS